MDILLLKTGTSDYIWEYPSAHLLSLYGSPPPPPPPQSDTEALCQPPPPLATFQGALGSPKLPMTCTPARRTLTKQAGHTGHTKDMTLDTGATLR